MGITNMDSVSASVGGPDKTSDDSFERFYNKDLDLDDEGNNS